MTAQTGERPRDRLGVAHRGEEAVDPGGGDRGEERLQIETDHRLGARDAAGRWSGHCAPGRSRGPPGAGVPSRGCGRGRVAARRAATGSATRAAAVRHRRAPPSGGGRGGADRAGCGAAVRERRQPRSAGRAAAPAESPTRRDHPPPVPASDEPPSARTRWPRTAPGGVCAAGERGPTPPAGAYRPGGSRPARTVDPAVRNDRPRAPGVRRAGSQRCRRPRVVCPAADEGRLGPLRCGEEAPGQGASQVVIGVNRHGPPGRSCR